MLTDKERAQLEDMAAFIQFQLDQDKVPESDVSFNNTLMHVSHDIGGLIRKDRCFLPRTDGYADLMRGKVSA